MPTAQGELESRIFRELQDVRFQIEQIVAQPEKAQFNQSRASQAIKTLKRIESEMYQLLGLYTSRSEVAKAILKEE